MTDDTNWRDRALEAEAELGKADARLFEAARDLNRRAEKAEAELARVTAEAAVMREALVKLRAEGEKGEMALDMDTRFIYQTSNEALSSTSAGAGLLKRLEASEAVCEASDKYTGNLGQHHYWRCSLNNIQKRSGIKTECDCGARETWDALEAWSSARGETK